MTTLTTISAPSERDPVRYAGYLAYRVEKAKKMLAEKARQAVIDFLTALEAMPLRAVPGMRIMRGA
jgi:hypothetical protein